MKILPGEPAETLKKQFKLVKTTWIDASLKIVCIMGRKVVINKKGVYFITFTCFQWLPLIELTNGYDLIFNWFRILKAKNFQINGFVIMPNHVHVLIYYPTYSQTLNTIIGNGKRFIAYELVRRLSQLKNRFYIEQLKIAVEDGDRTKGQKHNVWENSFEAKECRTKQFLFQKFNYIHNNPCAKDHNLSKTPEEYLHSSASFYKSNDRKHDFLTHYKEIVFI